MSLNRLLICVCELFLEIRQRNTRWFFVSELLAVALYLKHLLIWLWIIWWFNSCELPVDLCVWIINRAKFLRRVFTESFRCFVFSDSRTLGSGVPKDNPSGEVYNEGLINLRWATRLPVAFFSPVLLHNWLRWSSKAFYVFLFVALASLQLVCGVQADPDGSNYHQSRWV